MVKARTHEDCRATCCCICYLEQGIKVFRQITPNVEALIKEYVDPEYSRHDLNFPTVVCTTCQKALFDRARDVVYGLTKSDYFGSKIPRIPPGQKCECIICHRSRLNGKNWSLFLKAQKEKRGAATGETPAPSPADDAPKCPDCLSPVR